jgi:hypothetical protein
MGKIAESERGNKEYFNLGLMSTETCILVVYFVEIMLHRSPESQDQETQFDDHLG